jgi:hypothetical protein
MKQNKRFLVLALCTLALLFVMCSTNVFAADEVTVTGTVYPTALDENDNVIAAVIDTSMGESYVIVANAVGKKLFELEYEVVKASGVIDEDSEGNKTLSVTSYEVISESE